MHDLSRIIFPYCLKKRDDGTYIVLNRDYRPIGFDSPERVEYKDYPINIKVARISKQAITEIACHVDDTGTFWLYNDKTYPTDSAENMRVYLDKLKRLAKYKVTRKATTMNHKNQRYNMKKTKTNPVKHGKFYKWLMKQSERNDPIGDLAYDIKRDNDFPCATNDFKVLKEYLTNKTSWESVTDAFDEAVHEFSC